jgi:hypothetical protein
MATIASKFHDTLPVAYGDCANDLIVNNFFIDVTTAQLILNNVFDIGVIPAGHTVIDAVLIPDDLDSGTAIALDVGIMSGTPGDIVSTRTIGAEIFAANTAAQTGAIARPSLPSAFKILATQADRSVGVKVQTAPTTAVAGRIRLQLVMSPADHTLQF